MLERIASQVSALCVLLIASLASGAPTGEQVMLGDVTFNQDGSVTVIQASDGAVIHYDSFDIFAGEVVQFIQPSEHARVLNRVFGDATHIDGSLLANGIVYIVNPAGVFLDGNAVVEVGGLIAAAGSITDEDFLAGVDRFELSGPVVNASDSLHGVQLALLGTRVENHGSITAPDGTIALVAGERVVLARLGGRVMVEVDGPVGDPEGTGVVQAGHVDAGSGRVIFAVGDHYSLAINHEGVTRGGDVELRGGAEGVVLVSGEIDASSDGTGGSIRVLGDRIALVGARLDASGGAGGGRIRVGGDLRGGGDLPTARRTYVDEDSVLRADAIGSGDGGDVVVWGDEAAVMSGTLSARGGAAGGDGGFAEISSLGRLEADGDVDLEAPAGASGTLLFDPQDIVITGGTADGSDELDLQDDQLLQDPNALGEVLFGDVGAADPFVIYESEIEGTNANIVLEARNSITTAGTFDNEVAGEGTDVVIISDGNSLTMRTRNDVDDELGSVTTPGIDLAALEWRTSGGGGISLATGDDGTGGGGAGEAAALTVGDLVTVGGAVDLSTANGVINAGNIDTSGADGDTGGNAGSVDVDAGLGDVNIGAITATGGAGATGAGGAGGGVTVSTGDGSLTVASVDVSGGDGATDGGSAGFRIRLRAEDADGSGGNMIDVASDLLARGGEGLGGDGGFGGSVDVATVETPPEPPMDPDDPPPPPVGGGAIMIGGDVDTSGGNGTAAGRSAGRVSLRAAVAGDIDVGDIVARGGTADTGASGATENGGNGATILLDSDDGSIRTGSLDSSGGNGSTSAADPVDFGLRGAAGVIDVQAGLDGSGDLTLAGPVTAVDGDGFGDFQSDDFVRLLAEGAVSFEPAVAGPQIRTSEEVGLLGTTLGDATTPIEIDAVDLPADIQDDPRILFVQASESADVVVTTAGFNLFQLTADSTDADFDIAQVGVSAPDPANPEIDIDIDGSVDTLTVVSAEMSDADIPGGTGLQVLLADDLEEDMDENLTLRVGPGAIDGTTVVFLLSEDDVVLDDGAIEMRPVDTLDPNDPNDPGDPGLVEIRADTDADGDGAVLAGGAGVAIDMNADGMFLTGALAISAGSGVGEPGDEIRTANVEELGVQVSGTTGGSGGIHLVNEAGGDVTLAGGLFGFGSEALVVTDSSGDIDVENQVGSLIVTDNVRATGDMGSGGSVTLSVTEPDAEIRFEDASGALVEAATDVDLDGPVVLRFDADVVAGGDVRFGGTVDSDAATSITRNLSVEVGDVDGVARFEGDVGSGFLLRNLTVDGATELSESRSFAALQTVSFGEVNAASDDVAAMSVSAGNRVTFGGDVGTTGRLLGLDVESDAITLDAAGPQLVRTGADGIGLNTGGTPTVPPLATIGKSGGDLTLDTLGELDMGQNQKLTVDGIVNLVGDTVRLGDVSADEIHVDANVFELRARPAADFTNPGLGTFPDGGPDLVANLITTTSTPSVVGGGNLPRFATLSGSVGGAGAGGIQVVALDGAVTSATLVDESNPLAPTFYDLGIALPESIDETEERPPAVVKLLPARPGKQEAGDPALPPGSDQVLAFLRCAEQPDRDAPARDCARAPGSPLDSERGDDIAQRYARLFGSAPEAEAARQLLAGDPQREEREGVLRDVASFLAQLRLLGMEPAAYEQLRDQLLDGARGETEREALLADVRAHGRGLPL